MPQKGFKNQESDKKTGLIPDSLIRRATTSSININSSLVLFIWSFFLICVLCRAAGFLRTSSKLMLCPGLWWQLAVRPGLSHIVELAILRKN